MIIRLTSSGVLVNIFVFTYALIKYVHYNFFLVSFQKCKLIPSLSLLIELYNYIIIEKVPFSYNLLNWSVVQRCT